MKQNELKRKERELIDSNPFKERMKFFIEYPKILERTRLNLDGRNEIPNCEGMSLWVARVINPPLPIYLEQEETRRFLDLMKPGKVPGSIQVWKGRDPKETWSHATIYLGQKSDLEFSFWYEWKKPLEIKYYKAGIIFDNYIINYFVPNTLK